MAVKLSTLFALVFGFSFLGGCATSSIDYTPPVERKIQNSKLVQRPFDEVWDGLVKNLSSDFFVINNIDKNSRLINISFTAQTPSEYVDCGISRRKFSNARGERDFSYKTADSAMFSTTNEMGHMFNVRRTTRLEGRTNIYVAPESSGTNITVNTKYVLSITFNAVRPDGSPAGTETGTVDLSTKQGGTFLKTTCYAVGTIEDRILAMVR